MLLVLAADHVIENRAAFHRPSPPQRNMPAGHLVTFGIVPTGPETGYGYIHRGEQLAGDEHAPFSVQRFVEKPNLKTAQDYLASGEYYWNSGMFMFRAKRYLQELEKFRPDILDACRRAMANVSEGNDFISIDKDDFLACPDESVDYAVMEQTDAAVGAAGCGLERCRILVRAVGSE